MSLTCPKCNKTLVPMNDKHYAYCPKKDLVVKFGESYNRKYKLQPAPESGCGTLFEVPLSERDELAELERRYRPWKSKAAHGGNQKSNVRATTSGHSIQQGR